MGEFFPWVANWWALIALIAVTTWAGYRSARRRSLNSAVLCLALAGSLGFFLAPLSWASQNHRSRMRSVDVVKRETDPKLAERPSVKKWLDVPSGLRASAVSRQISTTDAGSTAATGPGTTGPGTTGPETLIVMARRQSNRVPTAVLPSLIDASPNNVRTIDAGPLLGAAACAPKDENGPTRCVWADWGSSGLIESDNLSVDQLIDHFDEARALSEYRVNRYHPYRDAAEFTLLLLLGAALTIGSIVAHEVAHALVARSLGGDVLTICIGAGTLLIDRDVAGVRVLVRLLPLGGYVQNVQRGAVNYQRNQALVCAAGPLTNTGLALVAGAVSGWGGPIVVLNALLAFVNLVPYSKYIPEAGRRVGTDGYQVWQVLSGRKQYDPDSVTAPFEVRAETALERGETQKAQVWVERGLATHPNAAGLLQLRDRLHPIP